MVAVAKVINDSFRAFEPDIVELDEKDLTIYADDSACAFS